MIDIPYLRFGFHKEEITKTGFLRTGHNPSYVLTKMTSSNKITMIFAENNCHFPIEQGSAFFATSATQKSGTVLRTDITDQVRCRLQSRLQIFSTFNNIFIYCLQKIVNYCFQVSITNFLCMVLSCLHNPPPFLIVL